MKNVYFLSDAHLGSRAIEHSRTQERRLVNFQTVLLTDAGLCRQTLNLLIISRNLSDRNSRKTRQLLKNL